MTERPFIVIDLDNTFSDYTTAFKECLEQMGYDGYADAPDPSDYSFACDDWFEDEDTSSYCTSVPWNSACICANAPTRVRWMRHTIWRGDIPSCSLPAASGMRRTVCGGLHAYGLDATPNWNLDLWRDTYPETFEWTIRDSCRRDGSGIRFCRIWDKTFLDADLTIEDNPHTLDRLMDKDMKVLVKRHAYNQAQCERAEQSGMGLAFDDWAQVPALAKRLVKENAK